MIEWTKSPVWLVQAFDAALPRGAGIERKTMFGYPAAFVRGNMATGLFREQLIVRLPEKRRGALLAEPGSAPFEPMPGRQMREYVVVSPTLVSDPHTLKHWIGEAAAYAASLPTRAKQTAKSPKKKTSANKTPKKKMATKKANKTSGKTKSGRKTKQPARARRRP
jgi:TfoX/Sxy family transcriptional regulator of competence genes